MLCQKAVETLTWNQHSVVTHQRRYGAWIGGQFTQKFSGHGQTVSADAIMTHCHTLIAGFKCPRSVDFRTDPLPLSGAGKILKTVLRKPYWEGHDKQVS